MEVNKQSLKLKASFLLLVCLFAVGAQAATKFKYCYMRHNYDLKVQTLNVSPDPVDPNKSWTFNVTATYPGEWIHQSCYQRDIEIYIDYAKSTQDSIKLDKSCDYTSFNGTTSIVKFSHTQPPRINDPPLSVKVNSEDEIAIHLCFEFKIKSKTARPNQI